MRCARATSSSRPCVTIAPTKKPIWRLPKSCRDSAGSSALHHALVLHAKPFDGKPHRVAPLQEDRVRLHALTNARWRTGGDHVARIQRDEVADIAHQLHHA